MQFKTTIEKFDSNLWSYYVVIPKNIGAQFIKGENRRVKCSINGAPPIQSALMPKGEIYSIYVKKSFMKDHSINESDQVDVQLVKDESDYGMPLPDTFEMLLDQDEEGQKLFKALTMGKQRSLVHIVGKVKNVDSQIAKGLAIMHQLKESNGALDFKRLNELIKIYNNRKI